jgi:hypothetical protein
MMPSYFPARELGVEVAPHEHGGQVILGAGPAREDVAHAVHLDGAAHLRAPGDEEIAHLLVGIGEGEATESSGLARPDLPRAHHCAPETAAVDSRVRVLGGHGSCSLSCGIAGSVEPGVEGVAEASRQLMTCSRFAT